MRLGYRVVPRCGSIVRSVFYHKTEWHGNGLVHQPLTDRRSRRAALGHTSFPPRRSVLLYVASRVWEFVVNGPVVFVIDDDSSVRASLKFLLSTVGLEVDTFDSAESFLRRRPPETASCLVLDVRLRGLSGLDLQRQLAAMNFRI